MIKEHFIDENNDYTQAIDVTLMVEGFKGRYRFHIIGNCWGGELLKLYTDGYELHGAFMNDEAKSIIGDYYLDDYSLVLVLRSHSGDLEYKIDGYQELEQIIVGVEITGYTKKGSV